MRFKDLKLHQHFNTKAARWVKTSSTEAVCIMSSLVELGVMRVSPPHEEVVPLSYPYSPVVDGPTLRNALRRVVVQYEGDFDAHKAIREVKNTLAAYDYNTKEKECS